MNVVQKMHSKNSKKDLYGIKFNIDLCRTDKDSATAKREQKN